MLRLIGPLPVALFALVGLLLASCATSAPQGAESATESAAFGDHTRWPLEEAASLGAPTGDRFNGGETVTSLPEGWRLLRIQEGIGIVEATLEPPGGNLLVVTGALTSSAELTRSGVTGYLVSVVLGADPLPPGDYYQALSDGSWYFGAPTMVEGEGVRLRVFPGESRYHFAAVRGSAEEISREGVERVLTGMRPAKSEEAVYVLRRGTVSGIDVSQDDWVLLEHSDGGITYAASREPVTLSVTVRTVPADSVAASGRRFETWIGPNPVVLYAESSDLSERYGGFADRFGVEVEIARIGEGGGTQTPREERLLLSDPSIQTLLETHLWFGEAR